MDIYLASAADALAINRPASTTDEDAYYARSTIAFAIPLWVTHLLALAGSGSRYVPARSPIARHA